ncbi:unnamed protein product, partial [Protopolystoma xenopodis]
FFSPFHALLVPYILLVLPLLLVLLILTLLVLHTIHILLVLLTFHALLVLYILLFLNILVLLNIHVLLSRKHLPPLPNLPNLVNSVVRSGRVDNCSATASLPVRATCRQKRTKPRQSGLGGSEAGTLADIPQQLLVSHRRDHLLRPSLTPKYASTYTHMHTHTNNRTDKPTNQRPPRHSVAQSTGVSEALSNRRLSNPVVQSPNHLTAHTDAPFSVVLVNSIGSIKTPTDRLVVDAFLFPLCGASATTSPCRYAAEWASGCGARAQVGQLGTSSWGHKSCQVKVTVDHRKR